MTAGRLFIDGTKGWNRPMRGRSAVELGHHQALHLGLHQGLPSLINEATTWPTTWPNPGPPTRPAPGQHLGTHLGQWHLLLWALM
jgi:hypothetical protein